MPPLRRFRFHLTLSDSSEPLRLEGAGAELARALLHQALAGIGAAFRGTGAPPFSLSPLHLTDGRPVAYLLPGGSAHFDVGTLTASLAQALAAAASQPPPPVGCDGAVAHLQINALAPGPATYESLFDYQAPPRQVGLRFLSPTVLPREDGTAPFPEPGTVFTGLLHRFNALSPFQFPEESAGHLGPLRVRRYHLRTVVVQHHGRRTDGLVGWVTYAFPPDFAPQLAYLAAALTRFARFSGVGEGTSSGLGQAEPAEER